MESRLTPSPRAQTASDASRSSGFASAVISTSEENTEDFFEGPEQAAEAERIDVRRRSPSEVDGIEAQRALRRRLAPLERISHSHLQRNLFFVSSLRGRRTSSTCSGARRTARGRTRRERPWRRAGGRLRSRAFGQEAPEALVPRVELRRLARAEPRREEPLDVLSEDVHLDVHEVSRPSAVAERRGGEGVRDDGDVEELVPERGDREGDPVERDRALLDDVAAQSGPAART